VTRIERIALVAVLGSSGCAQILGLDNTRFDQKDAPGDSPNVCDGAPACTSGPGRSVCGQLVDTGAAAGQALRAATPTGASCTTVTSDGPCALTVYGQPMASYFAGTTTDRVAGTIDDCGRYVVRDLNASAADVAVVFTGATIDESASVLRGRPTMAGTDTLLAPIVRTGTVTRWAMQLSGTSPPNVTGSYLVSYVSASTPIANEELRIGGASVGNQPTIPWGAYFTGALPYGDLDPAATKTTATGTAIVVPPNGSFMLGGFRTGANCPAVPLQAVTGALIHVTLSC
jgi:hypothetical protein